MTVQQLIKELVEWPMEFDVKVYEWDGVADDQYKLVVGCARINNEEVVELKLE